MTRRLPRCSTREMELVQRSAVSHAGRAPRPGQSNIMGFAIARLEPTLQSDLLRRSTERRQNRFRPGEGLGLAVGGAVLGLVVGTLALFGFGRVQFEVALAVGVIGYVCAVHLTSITMAELLSSREILSVVLFGLHLAFLIAWPIAPLFWARSEWQSWAALPSGFATLGLFLGAVGVPANAMYRVIAHVAVVTALGAYQWLWVVFCQAN
jgi:hypothetical protein